MSHASSKDIIEGGIKLDKGRGGPDLINAIGICVLVKFFFSNSLDQAWLTDGNGDNVYVYHVDTRKCYVRKSKLSLCGFLWI